MQSSKQQQVALDLAETALHASIALSTLFESGDIQIVVEKLLKVRDLVYTSSVDQLEPEEPVIYNIDDYRLTIVED